MSYFRNFGNVVCSQLLTKPNNLLLRSSNLPKALCESTDPSINHLHSVKALVSTIHALRTYQQSTEGQFKEEIQTQLNYLDTCKQQYKIYVRKYVESNGALTAEAIANLYAVAADLGLSNNWLESHFQNEIPNKVKYMSRSNLQDILNSLDKTNPNISLLEKHLSSKQGAGQDYVQRIGNEANQFEYFQNSKSNHHLVRALESGTSFPAYFAGKWICLVWSRGMSYLSGPSQYYLHGN